MTSDADSALVRQNVARLVRDVIRPAAHALNHYPDEPIPVGLLPALTASGIYDASSRDLEGRRSVCVTLATIAEASAAVAVSVLAHLAARDLLLDAGHEGTALGGAEATICGYALYAESGSTDRVPSIRSAGDAIEIDGVLPLAVNAPIARVLVFPVVTADGTLAIASVPTDAPGVRVQPALLTLGMRGAPTADVRFERVRLARQHLVASGPEATSLLDRSIRRLRAASLSISAGLLGASLRAAEAYAHERYQGGHAIIHHQEIRAILGRMIEDYAMCESAVDRLQDDSMSESRALALFLAARERAAHATCDGVQVLGGNGYMEDYDQERCMRDAKQAQCLFGRTDWMRQRLVAAHLAEGAP